MGACQSVAEHGCLFCVLCERIPRFGDEEAIDDVVKRVKVKAQHVEVLTK